MKRKNNKVTFKPYTQNQMMLPTDLNDLIPEKHLVRVVNDVINEMGLEPLLKKYKGGGTSSYQPRMVLKVLVYAYTQKIIFIAADSESHPREHQLHVVEWGKQAEFQDHQSVQGGCDEVSDRRGIYRGVGISDRAWVREGGELLHRWNQD